MGEEMHSTIYQASLHIIVITQKQLDKLASQESLELKQELKYLQVRLEQAYREQNRQKLSREAKALVHLGETVARLLNESKLKKLG